MMAIYDTTKDNIKLLKEFMSHSNEVIEKRDAVDHENFA